MKKTRRCVRAKLTFLGLSALIMCWLTVGCWTDDSVSPDLEDTIEIGALISLSGSNGGNGPMHLAAIQCAVEDANIELAAMGRAVRLSHADTQSDPFAAAVLLNTNLLRDVRITIGPYTSAEVARTRAGIAHSRSLLISPSSTSLELARDNDHIYRLAPNDSHMARGLAELIADRGHRYLVLVHRDDSWGNSVAGAMEREFTMMGGTIISRHAYGPADTGAVHTILAQAHDELVAQLGSGYGSEAALQLTSMSERSLFFSAASDSVPQLGNIGWYGSDGFVFDQTILNNPTSAEFAARVDFTAPLYRFEVPECYEDVVFRIERMTGVAPGPYALLSYDAFRIAATTLSLTDRQSSYADLEAALEHVIGQYYGVSGELHLDAAGDRANGDYDFYAVRGTIGWYDWVRIGQTRSRTTDGPN